MSEQEEPLAEGWVRCELGVNYTQDFPSPELYAAAQATIEALTAERDDYRDGAAAEADMVDELRTALAQERTAREAAEALVGEMAAQQHYFPDGSIGLHPRPSWLKKWLARAAALTAERSGTPVKDGQN